eukprot:gnl/TRDRNA2_/TRDRNA2_175265_c2_seq1.p1 gnl/TRDRNA2_/TRDRNA2_175265_c2~~gnl/TRDRNA2_/TRDRNA2_175265_c2_seq1.p1  ORF type:complete len:244 (-),score=65.17 gnl/TRDRNA2_/TRDRNA2_175265_c2_seq1:77-724(-)
MSNVQYLSAVVQGGVLDADSVEAAIEHVLTNLMPKRLQELTESEFDDFKSSFTEDLLQKPTGPSDEFSHYWSPVAKGGECFGLRDEVMKFLNQSLSTKAPLIEAYNKIMFPASGERRKMVVKYFAKKVPKRPTVEETSVLLRKYNVSEKVVAMVAREHTKTLILEKVDSTARKQIAKEGGYFPKDLNCKWISKKASRAAPTAFLQRMSIQKHSHA